MQSRGLGRGYGSEAAHMTTDQVPSIGATALAREVGFPSKYRRGSVTMAHGNNVSICVEGCGVSFTYRYASSGVVTSKVEMEYTHPHLGGVRWWMRCPRCGTRRARLWFASNGVMCRECARLVYPVTRWSPVERAVHALNRACALVGTTRQDIERRLPDKPKWMHWETFSRRMKAVEDAQDRHDVECAMMASSLLGIPLLDL